jgi:hypothetical protein
MEDLLKLKLMFILSSIVVKKDTEKLKSFIKICANHVEDSDFSKIFRKCLIATENQKCGKESCSDWLVNNLFYFYKTNLED